MHSLTKENTSGADAADLAGVEVLRVGVAWDVSTRGQSGIIGRLSRKVGSDLDLVAIALDENERPVRFAGLDSLDPLGNGSLKHSGDNETGHGEGDDETIDVNFGRVPAKVHAIVFMVAAFKKVNKSLGDKGFGGARNVTISVYDASGATSEQVADIWPSLLNNGNLCRVAKAFRSGSSWKLTVLDEMGQVAYGDEQDLMRKALA